MKILDAIAELIVDFGHALVKEWTKSRTIFTALFFGTLVYCILNKIPIPELLNTIVSTLLGYWYGQKQKTEVQPEGEQK